MAEEGGTEDPESTAWVDRAAAAGPHHGWIEMLASLESPPPHYFWNLVKCYAGDRRPLRALDQLGAVFGVDVTKLLPFYHPNPPEDAAAGDDDDDHHHDMPEEHADAAAEDDDDDDYTPSPTPSAMGPASSPPPPPPRAERKRRLLAVEEASPSSDEDRVTESFDSPARHTRSRGPPKGTDWRTRSRMSQAGWARKILPETDSEDDDDDDDAKPSPKRDGPLKIKLRRPSKKLKYDVESSDENDGDGEATDASGLSAAGAAAGPADDDDDAASSTSCETASDPYDIAHEPIDAQNLLPEHRGRVCRVPTRIPEGDYRLKDRDPDLPPLSEWSYFCIEDERTRRVRWLYNPAQIRALGTFPRADNAFGFSEGLGAQEDPDSLENQLCTAYTNGALLLWWSDHVQVGLEDVDGWEDVHGATIFRPPFLEGPYEGIVHVVGTIGLDTRTINHFGTEGSIYYQLEWIAERLFGDFKTSKSWLRRAKSTTSVPDAHDRLWTFELLPMSHAKEGTCALCGTTKPLRMRIIAPRKTGRRTVRAMVGINCGRRIQVAVDIYRNVIHNPEGIPSVGSLEQYMEVATTALRTGK